jgi:hypothetical protein
LNTPLWFQWPTTAKEAAELKLTNTDVLKLLNDIYGDNAAPLYAVETFTFAQLEPGKLYLIAAVDGSGRELFYGTNIVYCESAQSCTEQDIYDAAPHNYSDELIDLDGSGVNALLVKELAGGYEGGSSVNVFTYKVYKVTGGRATDVSDQYKTYYESTVLPKMKADLIRLRTQFKEQNELEIIDALGIMAQDDYARRILKEPTAGLDHAKMWAHSENRRLQRFAADALSHMDDPAAETTLAEMAQSDDEVTAKYASMTLEIRRRVRQDQQLKQSQQPQKR